MTETAALAFLTFGWMTFAFIAAIAFNIWRKLK